MNSNTQKLHLHTVQQADRTLWITVAVGFACALFVELHLQNRMIASVILAFTFYHLIRRLIKGPPVGIAILELAADVLIFRNSSSIPPRVDRITLDKLHSVCLIGEQNLRYFDCKLMSGETQRIGPFERGPSEIRIAEWFYLALPNLPFHVDPSATPTHRQSSRPAGM